MIRSRRFYSQVRAQRNTTQSRRADRETDTDSANTTKKRMANTDSHITATPCFALMMAYTRVTI